MKISVIGSGAMGSLFGGMLSAAGHEVVLFDIFQEHVDTVNSNGLSIESVVAENSIVHPFASSKPEAVADSDIMIFFVKSTATRNAAEQFAPLAHSGTIAVTLQNGVGNEEILRTVFGKEHTAAGVTSQGATFIGPGKIRHAGSGPTYLCMSDGNNERLGPFLSALREAGFEGHAKDDIDNLIWSKLIINVGINALTALTGQTNGTLPEHCETDELLVSLVEEAVAVTRKRGIELTYKDPVEAVRDVCRKTSANRSSMLQDFDRGKRTEIDFINGAIVREAKRLGMEVPVNKTVTRLIQSLERIHSSTTEKKEEAQ
ncbi:MAG: 2-dehydropantoate 2-reductase [Spirochaetales bacterium]|nr:2-dehydropantoate 2-reductase [Spirochaetales bacterium]MCF7938443.1 2-dehydropantoate 2-reductase [Spirochaetales bacterium]